MLISDTLTIYIVLLINDFTRSVVIRFLNHCWCWDLEYSFVSVQATEQELYDILTIMFHQSGSIPIMSMEKKIKGILTVLVCSDFE